ncbi:MAG: DUF1579 domain-containing protein, partial [Planctomycetes bacterium]|nr:DUF1579 domain-containing protein [Planctomycetota bacterium]
MHRLIGLTGSFAGASRLWLSPDVPPAECASVAKIAPAAKGRFLLLDYTWSYEGTPQEGMLLIDGTGSTAVWIDSWHMREKMMVMEGKPAMCRIQSKVASSQSYLGACIDG